CPSLVRDPSALHLPGGMCGCMGVWVYGCPERPIPRARARVGARARTEPEPEPLLLSSPRPRRLCGYSVPNVQGPTPNAVPHAHTHTPTHPHTDNTPTQST